jgi:hypothetical protein
MSRSGHCSGLPMGSSRYYRQGAAGRSVSGAGRTGSRPRRKSWKQCSDTSQDDRAALDLPQPGGSEFDLYQQSSGANTLNPVLSIFAA